MTPASPIATCGLIEPESSARLYRTIIVLLCALVIVGATFVVYMPCWHGNWLWDDDIHLLQNPVLKPGGLARIWVPGSYYSYWPLTYSAYWLGDRLWDLHPLGYHLTNIALHAAAALLLWRVLVLLRIPGAWLAAAIFAIHPVNVEAVAWVSQLKTVLGMMLALASVVAYLSFEQSGSRWRYWLAMALFLLAALAKTEVLPLPAVMLLLAWWQRGRIDRRDVFRVAPFFLIAGVLGAVEVWAQHLHDSTAVRTDGFLSRAAVAGCAVWFYFGKLIWPVNLIPFYPRWSIDAGNPIAYLPLALLVAILACAWRWRRGLGRPVLVTLLGYLAFLLPILGFVNINYMRYSLVADHWQYMAAVFPIAAFSAGYTLIARRSWARRIVWPGCAVALVALSVLTFRQSRLYGNPELYYRTTLERNPASWAAACSLGVILADRGDLEDAISLYRKALALNPDFAEAQNDLGVALVNRGEFDEALTHLQRAAQLDPWRPKVNYNLAFDYGKLAEFDLSCDYLRRELDANPHYQPARERLAKLDSFREKVKSGLRLLDQQLAQSPNDAALLTQKAWILATSPFASLRNGAESVEIAKRVSETTGGTDPVALGTLAAALAEAGRFDQAISAAEKAKQLAQANGNSFLASQLTTSLNLYHDHKAYRDTR